MIPDINKVRAGLRHCMEPDVCDGCEYLNHMDDRNSCGMHEEAIALIDAQEKLITDLEAGIKELSKAVEAL